MKKILLIGLLLMASCSSTRFVDSWKNKEITSFDPSKLLVVGMTDNLTARKIFEEELRLALVKRGVNAFESTGAIDQEFTRSQRSLEEIDGMAHKLVEEGFDAVIVTAVKGVDDRTNYRSNSLNVDYRWHRFGR